MESGPKRKRESDEDRESPTDPTLSTPQVGVSTHPESPSETGVRRLRRWTNLPPRSPSSAPSLSSVDPASQASWEELKLRAESRICAYKLCDRKNERYLSDTLHAALVWLPEGGRKALASDIVLVDLNDDNTLWEVFDNFRTAVVDAYIFISTEVQSTSKSLATPSPHPKRQADIDKVAAKLPEPQSHSSIWSEQCAARDNNCCVITGALNESDWKSQRENEDQLWGDIEVHYIIPFSLAGFDNKDDRDTATKWASIFTAFPKTRAIWASQINTLENGITLLREVHKDFQRFKIALMPTETPNSYRVKKYPRGSGLLTAYVVTGTLITITQAPGEEDKALPNRDFLDTHYRLCEIWHASGFAEVMEYNARRWASMKQRTCGRVVKEDGSSDLSEWIQAAFPDIVQYAG